MDCRTGSGSRGLKEEAQTGGCYRHPRKSSLRNQTRRSSQNREDLLFITEHILYSKIENSIVYKLLAILYDNLKDGVKTDLKAILNDNRTFPIVKIPAEKRG